MSSVVCDEHFLSNSDGFKTISISFLSSVQVAVEVEAAVILQHKSGLIHILTRLVTLSSSFVLTSAQTPCEQETRSRKKKILHSSSFDIFVQSGGMVPLFP